MLASVPQDTSRIPPRDAVGPPTQISRVEVTLGTTHGPTAPKIPEDYDPVVDHKV